MSWADGGSNILQLSGHSVWCGLIQHSATNQNFCFQLSIFRTSDHVLFGFMSYCNVNFYRTSFRLCAEFTITMCGRNRPLLLTLKTEGLSNYKRFRFTFSMGKGKGRSGVEYEMSSYWKYEASCFEQLIFHNFVSVNKRFVPACVNPTLFIYISVRIDFSREC